MHDNFGASPFNKIVPVISGLGLAISWGLIYPSELLALKRAQLETAIRREELIAEIATLANVSFHEAIEFCDSSGYGLEFIKAAIQAGTKLDEEDIKRTMEERSPYGYRFVSYNTPDQLNEIITKSAFETEQHTFLVILPNNERREVKARCMEVDGGSLYFEDEDHETVLAFGPGHWVWAQRAENDQNTGSAS